METSGAGPEPDELAGDLGVALERVVALARVLNSANPMSRSASGTLATLARIGPTRLTALAAREGVTQPAMTQLVGRLQGSGLVTREADPDDGRVVRVAITDAGRDLITARRAERTQKLAALLTRLTVEQRTALADAVPALDALADLHAGNTVPV